MLKAEFGRREFDRMVSCNEITLEPLWADNAGPNFKYFMVFNEEKDAIPEAKSLEDFLTILDNL